MQRQRCAMAVFLMCGMLQVMLSGCSVREHRLPVQRVTLEAAVQEFLASTGAPGVVVSVLRRGEDTPLSVAGGLACLENPAKMAPLSVMKIGSVTKAYTALRMEMLMEEGTIGPDTPLARFFPEFPGADAIHIRHLLTHTSGVPEMLKMERLLANTSKAWTAQEILTMVAEQPLDFVPGTRQQYSNSGYLLLGLIIEQVSGEPYERQILEHIAKPLGMVNMRIGDDTSIVPGLACGYSCDERGVVCKPMMLSIVPGFATGNLLGTAEDVVRLVNQGRILRNNLVDNPPSGPHILDTGETAYTHTQFQDLSYEESNHSGMATYHFPERAMTLVGKAGMFPGFATWFLYDPQTQTAVAVSTNYESLSLEAQQLAVHVLESIRRTGRQ